jgi:hypothetical protein
MKLWRYKGPCKWPNDLSSGSIIGTWKAVYSNYISHSGDFVPGTESIDGTERIVFSENGTYIQTFESERFNYASTENQWEFVSSVSEGPKLVMHRFKYYPHGLYLSSAGLELSPQTFDIGLYQDAYRETGIKAEKFSVDYPKDGFVFLYPRICLGKLALLHMVAAGLGDPDSLGIDHPPFEKTK